MSWSPREPSTARRVDRVPDARPRGVEVNAGEVVVVQARPPQLFVLEGKSERLHEVQRRPGVGAHADDVPGVGRDLGGDEHDVDIEVIAVGSRKHRCPRFHKSAGRETDARIVRRTSGYAHNSIHLARHRRQKCRVVGNTGRHRPKVTRATAGSRIGGGLRGVRRRGRRWAPGRPGSTRGSRRSRQTERCRSGCSG